MKFDINCDNTISFRAIVSQARRAGFAQVLVFFAGGERSLFSKGDDLLLLQDPKPYFANVTFRWAAHVLMARVTSWSRFSSVAVCPATLNAP